VKKAFNRRRTLAMSGRKATSFDLIFLPINFCLRSSAWVCGEKSF
jgi:hypothetical protein